MQMTTDISETLGKNAGTLGDIASLVDRVILGEAYRVIARKLPLLRVTLPEREILTAREVVTRFVATQDCSWPQMQFQLTGLQLTSHQLIHAKREYDRIIEILIAGVDRQLEQKAAAAKTAAAALLAEQQRVARVAAETAARAAEQQRQAELRRAEAARESERVARERREAEDRRLAEVARKDRERAAERERELQAERDRENRRRNAAHPHPLQVAQGNGCSVCSESTNGRLQSGFGCVPCRYFECQSCFSVSRSTGGHQQVVFGGFGHPGMGGGFGHPGMGGMGGFHPGMGGFHPGMGGMGGYRFR